MPSAEKFLKSCHAFLANTGGFSSFPLSLLLVGLEKVIELKLSCPCSNDLWNKFQILFIFIGPFLFITAVMFILLKPFGYENPQSSTKATQTEVESESDAENGRRVDGENDNSTGADSVQISFSLICCVKNKTKDDQTNGPKANEDKDVPNNFEILANCLIPPVIWVIILLLDGDYLACSQTTWKGNYVFNKQLNRKWCQPIKQSRAGNESDSQHKYETFIGRSQLWGYLLLAILSLLIICKVCYFNYQRRKLNSTKQKQSVTKNGKHAKDADEETVTNNDTVVVHAKDADEETVTNNDTVTVVVHATDADEETVTNNDTVTVVVHATDADEETVTNNDTVVVHVKNGSQVADEENDGENGTWVDDGKNVDPRDLQLEPLLNKS